MTWVGFQHEDKGHPHVHVVVAGSAGGKQVGLYERDINRLRGYAEREKERQALLTRLTPERDAAGRSEREEAARLYELTHQVRERDSRGR